MSPEDRKLLQKQMEGAISLLRGKRVTETLSAGNESFLGSLVLLSQMIQHSPERVRKEGGRLPINGRLVAQLQKVFRRWHKALVTIPLSLDGTWDDFLELVRVLHEPQEHESAAEELTNALVEASTLAEYNFPAQWWINRATRYIKQVLPFWLKATGSTEDLPMI